MMTTALFIGSAREWLRLGVGNVTSALRLRKRRGDGGAAEGGSPQAGRVCQGLLRDVALRGDPRHRLGDPRLAPLELASSGHGRLRGSPSRSTPSARPGETGSRGDLPALCAYAGSQTESVLRLLPSESYTHVRKAKSTSPIHRLCDSTGPFGPTREVVGVASGTLGRAGPYSRRCFSGAWGRAALGQDGQRGTALLDTGGEFGADADARVIRGPDPIGGQPAPVGSARSGNREGQPDAGEGRDARRCSAHLASSQGHCHMRLSLPSSLPSRVTQVTPFDL